MKRIIIVILLFLTTLDTWSNNNLPWDSLFSEYGLTQEMTMIPKYVSLDLNINYTDGAMAGIWGLTTPVARRYGLIVNNDIDQRYDLKLASEVAACYLKDLMIYYGDEKIAILAYLNGAARMVDVARIYGIDLHNTTDAEIDILCNNLPKSHIYDSISFIDFCYLDSIYNHTGYKKYKFDYPIRISTLQDSLFLNIDNFYRHNSAIRFSTRWIDEAYMPESFEIKKLSSIYDLEREALLAEQSELDKQKKSEEKTRITAIKKANAVKVYHVKSGDTLSHIAKRHKVSVRQIKQWNNLKSDFLRVGQKLKIHTS